MQLSVEEYRNGVKIGEVRRDAQYKSEACVLANPPQISINDDPNSAALDTFSVDVYVKDSICFDIEVGTNDPLDSLYLKLTSSTFDLFDYMQPVAYSVISGNNSFAYDDWNNNVGDSVNFGDLNLLNNGYLGTTGTYIQRYCWQAPCEGIDSTFFINMDSYSVDCSGYNQVIKELVLR